MGQRGHLQRGGIGVGGVGVGHRLDDDRMAGADLDAADVDRRPSAGGRPSELALQDAGVEQRQPDEQAHQDDEAGQVDQPLSGDADAVVGGRLDDATATRPPSSGGNGSTLTTARLADSSPISQMRKTGGS